MSVDEDEWSVLDVYELDRKRIQEYLHYRSCIWEEYIHSMQRALVQKRTESYLFQIHLKNYFMIATTSRGKENTWRVLSTDTSQFRSLALLY